MGSALLSASTQPSRHICDTSTHTSPARSAHSLRVLPLHALMPAGCSQQPLNVSTTLFPSGFPVESESEKLHLSKSISSAWTQETALKGDKKQPSALGSRTTSAIIQDRRGLPGPMRSIEVSGNSLVAFGRTVLTNVPADVIAGAGKDHAGPAAADTQGIFLGVKQFNSSSRHVFSLGTLRGLRFLSCFRFKLWWMTQRVGTNGREIPYETQFLLLECPPLLHNMLEGSFRSSLQGGLEDQLDVCVESGDPSITTCNASEAVYVHAGRNPFRTISEAVRAVEAHSDSFMRRELKTLPGLLDHFGWCTWDAFYTDVTAQGVNEGLEELANGGTPAKFLIIDDGWQTVTDDTEKAKGKITAGTQYASRLTCVKENHKFKAGASLKAKTTGVPALEESEVRGDGQGVPGGASGAARVPNGAENGAAENGAAPAMRKELEGRNRSNDEASMSPVQSAAEAAAAAALAAEESRLAGLGDLVRQVKATHSVKFVYVWHALLGYWGGVKPGPQGGMERFDPLLAYPVPSLGVLTNQPDMAEDTLTLNGLGVVAPGKAFHFYDELHSYLASCGVDGVKVDVQNILETVGAGHGGRVALARSYHAALESSIKKNFHDNGIISCMSHNTDGLYLAKQTAVMRASDDFWPTDPASHTVHIISVAYNSLFLGEFMQPDWDMFQSLHPAAEFHGAARAAGGCAVYVSDKPGQHDFSVLRKLVFPDGSILRARLPGRPTRDCLFTDPARDTKSLLKIWNLNHCNGIVAAFNCQGAAWCRENRKYAVHNAQPGTVTGVVSAEDVDALAEVARADWAGDVVVYSHFADELVSLPYHTNLVVSLHPLHCEVYTFAPITEINGVQFAPLGFGRMYNAGGAVLSSACAISPAGECSPSPVSVEPRVQAAVQVRGGGNFLAFASQQPSGVQIDGTDTDFEYSSGEGRITIRISFTPTPKHVIVSF